MKRKLAFLSTVFCFFLLFGCSNLQSQPEDVLAVENETIQSRQTQRDSIIYVAEGATGAHDGSSWTDAYTDLQVALAQSKAGDQIWVAKGTYYPSLTDVSVSFSLVDGTDLYGGFAGTETSIDQRDLEANTTILSGEIGDPLDVSDNINNILLATNGTIDGFTIIGGYSMKAMGPSGQKGQGTMGPPPLQRGQGAMDTAQVGQRPALLNGNNRPNVGNASTGGAPSVGHSSPGEVTSGDAESTMNGAGLVVWNVSAVVKNVIIENCTAGKGGGIYINNTGSLDKQPFFYHVAVQNCSSFARGGGVSIDMMSNPLFIDCAFLNNHCDGKGGGIYDDFGCSPRLYNCLFSGNSSEMAGAMGNDGVSNAVIVNCTFTENEADQEGAALYQGTGPYNDPIVKNSIISDNICDNGEASIYNFKESNTAVYDSFIEGGYSGLGRGIIDDKAMFDLSYNCLNDTDLGYKSAKVGKRTDSEIETIQQSLLSVSATTAPTPLDVTNYGTKTASQNVLYVASEAQGTQDGSSASNAMDNLQEAIYEGNNYYLSHGTAVTIYLAAGTYTPGTERSDSFILLPGVHLVGEREATTILSGEIGTGSSSDNCYHVVIGSDEASLSSVTITGGYADGQGGEVYDQLGGGLLNYLAGNRVKPTHTPTLGFDTTLNHVTFINNYAMMGGAVYTYHGGNPTFTQCSFINNTANYGGATYEVAGCAAVYSDCTYEGNSAAYMGGATFVDYGSLTAYYDCSFTHNEAATCGGVTYIIDRASQSIINDTHFTVLIDSSWSNDTDIFSTAYFEDCTMVGNTAPSGNDLMAFEGSYVKLVNTDVDSSNLSISSDSHLIEE
jgi:hypothetical protein